MGGDSIAVLPPGLPNIEGTGAIIIGSSVDGAFYITSGPFTLSGENWYGTGTLNFNASLSNPIYGNSNTVTPASFMLLPQIKF